MIPYEFTKPPDQRRDWREVPRKDRPHTPIIDLHRLLQREFEKAGWDADVNAILSEKARWQLFRVLWPGSPVYRRDGWAFDFRPVLNRYLILAGPAGAHLAYAPSKELIVEESHFHTIQQVRRIENDIAEEYREYRQPTAPVEG